jgi:hypothetical protein
MKTVGIISMFLISLNGLCQPCSTLVFQELGFEHAYCRIFSYQSGNGVVYAAATGGTPDYNYLWTNIQTGAITSNTTWGGLNPGDYEIKVTDDAGCILIDTITVDSLNPIADFDVVSAQLDVNLESNMQASVLLINQSLNFANPNDPNADTTFYWNLNTPFSNWQPSYDVNETKDTLFGSNGSYDVCLITLNKNGCDDTLCKTITIHGYAELFDYMEVDEISIWYTNGQIRYYLPESVLNSEIFVYDVNGREVEHFKPSVQFGSFNFYAESGIYFYSVMDLNFKKVFSGKIILN